MENLKTKLGKRIKSLRKSRNITHELLAEMINMDITSLSKIETGRNYPQPETLEKISKALNLDISCMFTFKIPATNQDYIEAIKQNISAMENDTQKLEMLYNITSAMI